MEGRPKQGRILPRTTQPMGHSPLQMMHIVGNEVGRVRVDENAFYPRVPDFRALLSRGDTLPIVHGCECFQPPDRTCDRARSASA